MRLYERYILGVGLLCLGSILMVVFYVSTPKPMARGIHTRMQAIYKPDKNGKFRCPISDEVIDFEMVNDDYCDCKDGGDEPGTSACAAGLFFCKHDTAHEGREWVFSTSRVNDGICDCVDGSDEYDHNKVLSFRLDDDILEKLGRGMSPCKDRRELEDSYVWNFY